MTRHRILVLLVAGCVAACSAGGRDQSPTIGSLGDKPVEVRPSAPLEATGDKAAESYRAFLELSDDHELRAEAMRRLGDLALESTEARLADETGGEQPFNDAIQQYESLLETYPDYENNDSVLYQLARAYENNGRPDQALVVLNQIIARHPDTQRIDEVQFRRGEILFLNQRYGEAERAYTAVLDFGETSEFYDESLYKHGWSLFKQSFHEEGLNSFFVLFDRMLLSSGAEVLPLENFESADRELVEDTLRVSAVSFSYFTDLDAVGSYLEMRRRPYEHLLYATLGSLYLEQERYVDAADTYIAFAERNPVHADAPALFMRAIDAYAEGDFPSLVLDGKKAFIERYQLTEIYWQHNDPVAQPEVVAYLKQNLTDIAQHYHAVAQAAGTPESYAEAAHWYRTFLGSFPQEPEAARMNFLLAEILFESGDYRQAAHEYERTAYEYPPHADGAEAGYAALLAYTEHAEQLDEPERTEWHRESIVSSLKFANTYPAHPESERVITKAAADLFALNDMPRAAQVSTMILQRNPPVSPQNRLIALTVLGHSQFDLNQFGAAEAAYTQALMIMPADDEKRDDIVARLASSVYKQGEAARDANDMAAAVDHFRRVAVVAPGSSIVPTAEYDAAAALIGLERWGEAAGVLEDFRARYPDHELNNDVDEKLAAAYLKSDQPVKAAGELERIASTSTDRAVREQSLWQAQELYEQAGMIGETARVLTNYVNEFSYPVEPAIEARQKLAGIYEQQGDTAGYHYWLNEIVIADAGAGSERSTRTKYLAAKASMVLAEPVARTYRAITLTVPLDQSLPAKKSQMERALDAYARAADYGVSEVTTAATYRIAEIYDDFGRALMESQRPAGLNTDEFEQYEILLEEQAFPFEEQAIDLHEVNVGRLSDGVYDEWVKASLEALAKLMPARYAKTEKSENAVASMY